MDLQQFVDIFNAHYLGTYSMEPGEGDSYEVRYSDGRGLVTKPLRTIKPDGGNPQLPKSEIKKIYNALNERERDGFPFIGELPLSIAELTDAFDAARIINALTAHENGGTTIELNTGTGTYINDIVLAKDEEPDADLALNNIAKSEVIELAFRFRESTAIPSDELDQLADSLAAEMEPTQRWIAAKARLRPRVEGRLIGERRTQDVENKVPIERVEKAIAPHGVGENPGSKLKAVYSAGAHSTSNNADVAGSYRLNTGAGQTREIVIYQDKSTRSRYTDFNGVQAAVSTVYELSDAAGLKKAEEEIFAFKNGEKVKGAFDEWRKGKEEEGQ